MANGIYSFAKYILLWIFLTITNEKLKTLLCIEQGNFIKKVKSC